MGSGNDYSSQVQQGLDQANRPKSNLSQQYSGLLGGVAPGILNALMNTQGLGNSFLNVNGAQSNNGQNGFKQGIQNWGGPHQNPINPPQIQPPSSFNPNPNGTLKPFDPSVLNNQPHPFTHIPFGNIHPGGTTGGIRPGLPQVGNQGFDGSPNKQAFPEGMNPGLPQIAMENNDGDLGPPQQRFPQGMGNGDLGPPQHGGGMPQYGYGGSADNIMRNVGITGMSGPINPGGPTGLPTDNPPIIQTSDKPPGGYNQTVPNTAYSPIEQQGMNMGQGMQLGQGQQGGINVGGYQNSNPQLAQMLGMGNFSNTNPQIQQLLNGVGNNIREVDPQMSGGSGFSQQYAKPGEITDPNFQAQGANLNGINTGTQLSGDSLNSYNNIAQILGNQQKQAMADQHERFTGVGGARSSGASLADAQMQAQMQPQMAQALSGARNNEVSNQLQSAGLQSSNAMQNAGMMNQYGLGGAQLNVQRQGQNISNMMNAAGINNQYGLGNAQLGAQINQSNQGANLQGQMANQSSSLQQQQNNNGLLAQLLGQQGQNVGQTNNANLGMNSIMQSLSQGNAQGANQYNLATAGMNQQAAMQQQSQAQNALMALFGMGGSLAGAGIPGGSANINVGGQQGSNFGSNMQGLASILSMFGG